MLCCFNPWFRKDSSKKKIKNLSISIMHNTRFYIKIIIYAAFMLSCFHNNPDIKVSPDINTEDSLKKKNNRDNDLSKDLNVEKNMREIIKDLRMDIKKGVEDVMKDTSEAGLARSIEVDNLKLEFPGISDDIINNILTDTNPQRIAEVKQTMREALKMGEKGMSPDDIINAFKDTTRTKQASGGLIPGYATGGVSNLFRSR